MRSILSLLLAASVTASVFGQTANPPSVRPIGTPAVVPPIAVLADPTNNRVVWPLNFWNSNAAPTGVVAAQGGTASNLTVNGTLAANGALVSNVNAAVTRKINDGPPLILADVNGASDVEDAAWFRLAAQMHKAGTIRLLGIGIGGAGWSNVNAVGGCGAVLGYSHVTDVPIGGYTNTTFGTFSLLTNGTYPTGVSWPNVLASRGLSGLTNQTVDPAVSMYRRQLASAPSQSVTFLVEEPAVLFSNLLFSAADQFSPLSGKALFADRVKQVIWMAGDYTNSAPANGEYNFNVNVLAALYCLTNVTSPILFEGFSLGSTPSANEPSWLTAFRKGWAQLHSANPLYNLTYLTGTSGDSSRPAWACESLILAAYGTNYLGTNIFQLVNTGTNVLLASGSNYWNQDLVAHGQAYVSYVNTNVVQGILDSWLYSTVGDAPNGLPRRQSDTFVRLDSGCFGVFGSSNPTFFVGNDGSGDPARSAAFNELDTSAKNVAFACVLPSWPTQAISTFHFYADLAASYKVANYVGGEFTPSTSTAGNEVDSTNVVAAGGWYTVTLTNSWSDSTNSKIWRTYFYTNFSGTGARVAEGWEIQMMGPP